jgi:quercetin dioxygenase-like cupin family protein
MSRTPSFIPANVSGRSLLGESRRLKLDAATTGGDLYLVEGTMPEGSSVPLHVHQHEDEIFHVLEGEVLLTLGDETYEGKAGDMVYLPRSIPHSIATKGPATARVLNYVFPGKNFEAFFEQLQTLEAPTPKQRAAVAKKFGITFL